MCQKLGHHSNQHINAMRGHCWDFQLRRHTSWTWVYIRLVQGRAATSTNGPHVYLLLSAINPFHQRLNRESTSKSYISASQCKAHPYVFCTCASKRSAALSPVTVGGGDTLTFSMVEKSCEDEEEDLDADALGTKAWLLVAEAARRSRAERALLLPTIMLFFFWASKWLLIGRSQRICCSCFLFGSSRRTRIG